jgi:phosphoglycolate phosphatase
LRQPRNTIVFDLDGTLVDTAGDLAAATNQALEPIGRRPVTVAEVRGMIGGGFPNLIDQGLRATGGPLEGDAFDEAVATGRAYYTAHVADLTRPNHGVQEALAAFARQGVKMGVCTNKPAAASQAILDQLGLAEYLPVLVGGDTLPVMKPDPAMIMAVLDRLDSDVADAVLVGDSETDVALARGAGVPVILVRGGYTLAPAETLGADVVVDNFTEISAAIAQLS